MCSRRDDWNKNFRLCRLAVTELSRATVPAPASTNRRWVAHTKIRCGINVVICCDLLVFR